MAVALPYIYLAVAAYGTYTAVQSADTQAKQEQANLNYQAAQTAADAKAAQGEAEVEAARIRKQAQTQRNQATAAAAASGIDVTSPTAIKIDQHIQATGEEDAITTLLNGSDTGARMNNQAAVDRTGASLVMSNAKQQETATLLSSAANTMGTYSQWKKAG